MSEYSDLLYMMGVKPTVFNSFPDDSKEQPGIRSPGLLIYLFNYPH